MLESGPGPYMPSYARLGTSLLPYTNELDILNHGALAQTNGALSRTPPFAATGHMTSFEETPYRMKMKNIISSPFLPSDS